MKPVVIYTTRTCSYCNAAKRLMEKKKVSYEEIDVSDDHDKRMWLARETGMRTVPQIFIGGKSYGGYDDVNALDRKGELDAILK